MKLETMKEFKDKYQRLKDTWGGYNGYDTWVAGANNAAFGAQAAYDNWTPAFTVLFEQEARDWTRFFDAAKQLAQLPVAERRNALQKLSRGLTSG